jgi:hypothetical protein
MREKSFVAAVTSDLKNMATQQEIYLGQYLTYASVVGDLDLTVTDNVTLSINEAAGTGWAATGTHAGLGGRQCGTFYGSASPSDAPPAVTPGAVLCN